MASEVRRLTEKRKRNLRASGKGKNSMNEYGLKPSGPDGADYPLSRGSVGGWAALAGGIGLSAYGIYRLTTSERTSWRDYALAILGGGLAYRAVSGLFFSDEMGPEDTHGLENPAAAVQHTEGIKVEETVMINRPAEDLYQFWRNFENLPAIMHHLKSVEVLSEIESHWVVEGPAGMTVEWDAEIYTEIANRQISWRSIEGSDVEHAGSVTFRPSGSGTEVTVMLKYNPPAGKLGAMFAKLFGEDAASQIAHDLGHFKEEMESGSSSSQSSSASLYAPTSNGFSRNGHSH